MRSRGKACSPPQAQGIHQRLSTVTGLQSKRQNQSGLDYQKSILPKYHPKEIKVKKNVQLKTLVLISIVLRPSSELKPLSVSANLIIIIRCLLFSLAMRKHAEKEDRPRDVNLRTVKLLPFFSSLIT
jgi:hypothetical protein